MRTLGGPAAAAQADDWNWDDVYHYPANAQEYDEDDYGSRSSRRRRSRAATKRRGQEDSAGPEEPQEPGPKEPLQ